MLYTITVLLSAAVGIFAQKECSIEEMGWDSPLSIAYLVYLLISVLIASLIMLRFFDKRAFATLGYSFDSGWTLEALTGIATGFLIIIAIFVMGTVSGIYRASLHQINLPVLAGSFVKYLLLIFMLAVFEEVLFRGYVFQTLVQGIGRIGAIILVSIFFGLGHYFNPNGTPAGAINTGLAGIFLAVAYLKTRSLWLPSFIHFSWNFTLGYILSFPVSGIRLKGAPLTVEYSGLEILTGGEFGPEASLFTTIVLLVVTILFIFLKRLRPSEPMARRWDKFLSEKHLSEEYMLKETTLPENSIVEKNGEHS
ncbi:MAG: CPBP family intramembrane glutamic endopeptidase [Acidobacteriota bacterium]